MTVSRDDQPGDLLPTVGPLAGADPPGSVVATRRYCVAQHSSATEVSPVKETTPPVTTSGGESAIGDWRWRRGTGGGE